jgi:hydroxymethylpyrimidine/phosphomethylpyrimidine kinase
MEMKGRVLVIAGSDSGGGAGIQADIKTITALGGYAATAITAITAQSTKGVEAVYPLQTGVVQQQIRVVLEDIGADVIKLGMLYDADMINAVADVLDELAPHTPTVLDPVMVAKGGEPLLDQTALRHMKIRLLPRTTLLTPNIPEAELMAGMDLSTLSMRRRAASMMLTLGAKAVLLKGGHGDHAEALIDMLVTEDETIELYAKWVETRHTHGTGCTFASAVACGLAQELSLRDAVARAHAYVHAAIKSAPGFGHGFGPLNHAVTVAPFNAPE